MERDELLERIEIDPKVMLGKPVVRGTRVTVEQVLDTLASDASIDDVLRNHPRLVRDDVLAAIVYARHAIGTDEFIPRIKTA